VLFLVPKLTVKTVHLLFHTKSISSSFTDSAEARCLPDAETNQEVVLSAMERYCKNRFPDETFRFGRILLKLMGLRAVNANDLEFLFFSKMLHHSSIAGVIRNQLVSDLPSPGHRSPYKETSFTSTCQ